MELDRSIQDRMKRFSHHRAQILATYIAASDQFVKEVPAENEQGLAIVARELPSGDLSVKCLDVTIQLQLRMFIRDGKLSGQIKCLDLSDADVDPSPVLGVVLLDRAGMCDCNYMGDPDKIEISYAFPEIVMHFVEEAMKRRDL